MYKATFKHTMKDASMVLYYKLDVKLEDFDVYDDDDWELVELIDLTPSVVPEPEVEPPVV